MCVYIYIYTIMHIYIYIYIHVCMGCPKQIQVCLPSLLAYVPVLMDICPIFLYSALIVSSCLTSSTCTDLLMVQFHSIPIVEQKILAFATIVVRERRKSIYLLSIPRALFITILASIFGKSPPCWHPKNTSKSKSPPK